MMWINGQQQDALTVRDRAVQFGDGCFTTSHVDSGRIKWLPAHIERLRYAAERLLITGVAWMRLEQEMVALASTQQQAVLKVILTRGCGGHGYSPAGCAHPARIISVLPYPAHYPDLQRRGVQLETSPVRLSLNPLLAGIKHLNRLEQVLIRSSLEESTADEALVLDYEGFVVECCAANLFWRKQYQVFTPDVSQAGVRGIMRQHVIEVLRQQGYTCTEVRVPPSALADADEVFITNALMPVLPVNQIDRHCFTSRNLFNLVSPQC